LVLLGILANEEYIAVKQSLVKVAELTDNVNQLTILLGTLTSGLSVDKLRAIQLLTEM
jgi:hypothetical protein